MRYAWLTDIHLDHLRPWPEKRHQFAYDVAAQSDGCIISGDISTFVEADLFAEFADRYAKPVYFVLGNHDFWGGNFRAADEQIKRLCSKKSNLIYLTSSKPVEIAPDVELCGVDGWYDARFGSWRDSSFAMVDWQAIRDFYGMQLVDIVAECRNRAKGEAVYAYDKLKATSKKRVLFVTHVPPYWEVAMHEGKPSSRSAVPYYTSKIMGETLSQWAKANPDRELTTLCGHVHSPAEFDEAPNHKVLCGYAAYGKPSIVRVFEF